VTLAEPVFLPYRDRYDPGTPPEQAARELYEKMCKRRSIRSFSDRPVSRETIEWVVQTAASAPSGANKQPWRFVCVQDPELKRRIREGAEIEEREFYKTRATERWLKDLEPLGTDSDKPYLDVAPWLIVVFKIGSTAEDQIYYATESVGLASGFLLAACHLAGLATLTHTPSPMGFLNEICGRPKNERPFLLIPVGYPTDDCVVPEEATKRKPLDETLLWL
jgi:nitroreductase